MLRHDLAQNHLLGEVLGPHRDRAITGTTGEPAGGHNSGRRDHAAGHAHPGQNFCSIHDNPLSAAKAISAAGAAPARICVESTEASPRKINTPKPPPPIAAAIVAVPIVITVATLTPARIVLAARGSSTSQRSCRPVIPISMADSRTARSTPRMPVKVFCKMGKRA